MTESLTAAGLQMCISLLGNDPALPLPTYQKCVNEIYNHAQRLPPDKWGRAPVLFLSCAGEKKPPCGTEPPPPFAYKCDHIATMTGNFDGTGSKPLTSFICRRPASIRYSPAGLWYWNFDDETQK